MRGGGRTGLEGALYGCMTDRRGIIFCIISVNFTQTVVAQLVEWSLPKQKVVGSNPTDVLF